MKKGKTAPVRTTSAPVKPVPPPAPSAQSRKVFIFLFGAVLLATIVFKIYKADQAGIIFDESRTFRDFARSPHAALNFYSSPNNHVINSLLIYYAHKLFSFYEHFIRIPSLIAGILFSLALAYIVTRTFSSYLIRIVMFGLVSLVPAVFDYSFVARGYAFGLAGIYMEIALALWLLKHRIKYQYLWIPVLLISALNFLALGAVLTSIFFLFSINLIFVLFYSSKVLREPPIKRWKPIIFNGIGIFLITAVSSYLLYRGLLDKIPNNENLQAMANRWKGWPTFVSFLNTMLVKGVFRPNDTAGIIIFRVVLVLLVASIAYHIYRFIRKVKAGQAHEYLPGGDPGNFVLMVTGTAFLLMFIIGVVLKKSLGFERNIVFFVPMALLSLGIILDRFGCWFGMRLRGQALRAVLAGVIIAVTIHNRPSYCYAIGGQSVSGPLLRRLKAIDPDKTWKITLTEKTKNHRLAINFYEKYYNFTWVGSDNYDVMVCQKDEMLAQQLIYLDWDFFRNFNCAVLVNFPLPFERMVLDAKIKKD
ncbi:hypothetical protein ACFL02_00125 [Planctomycetota bacterium]